MWEFSYSISLAFNFYWFSWRHIAYCTQSFFGVYFCSNSQLERKSTAFIELALKYSSILYFLSDHWSFTNEFVDIFPAKSEAFHMNRNVNLIIYLGANFFNTSFLSLHQLCCNVTNYLIQYSLPYERTKNNETCLHSIEYIISEIL